MCHGDEGRLARCSFRRSSACRESIASVETALRATVRVSAGGREQTGDQELCKAGVLPCRDDRSGPGDEGTAESACESERGQLDVLTWPIGEGLCKAEEEGERLTGELLACDGLHGRACARV